MLVPLSWLKDFLPLEVDATDRGALRRLGETLDSLGLVVERIEQIGQGLEGVVVARVAHIEAIEGADRIRRVLVDIGAQEPVEVVCGAWNFVLGDLVPLATVGSELPNGMVISRRKMKGVASNGMLCSPAELALASESDGILVLEADDPEEALGRPLVEHLGIVADAVYDLAIEPNRPDCLSILGIARDLAAVLHLPLTVPVPAPVAGGAPVGELAALRIEDETACARLVAIVLSDLGELESPPAVARRLELAGMRPINAVVDASNYVMLELGQPTHAYDLDALAGPGIAIRRAQPGERVLTLDGVERVLAEGAPALGIETGECVVTDLDGTIVGLAGVMGGAESEVRPSTTRVLLEVAAFAAPAVAGAARRHGLRSEASVRFERGIDPEGLVRAALRVAELITEAARAAGVKAPVLASGILEEAPGKEPRRHIVLRTARMNGLLGTSLSPEEAARLLEPIGFGTCAVAEGLEVEVPSFRPDVRVEVDVVEEVARHFGYENIEPTERRSPSVGRLTESQADRRTLRRLLTGFGADEAWGNSIVDPTIASRLGIGVELVGLENPMASEESVLRSHLLPGLLGALRNNVSRRNDYVRLFEIGDVFAKRVDEEAVAIGHTGAEGLLEERTHLGVLLAGIGDDALSAVALWRRLLEGLRIEESSVRFDQERASRTPSVLSRGRLEDDLALGLHPTRAARLYGLGEQGSAPALVGALGEVDPGLLESFGLGGERRVGWLVADVERLLGLRRRSRLSHPISKFPSSDLDLAFVLDKATPAGLLVACVQLAGGGLVASVDVLDVYRGEAIDEGARSVTLRLRLSALDRTLTDSDIASVRSAVVARSATELGARLTGA